MCLYCHTWIGKCTWLVISIFLIEAEEFCTSQPVTYVVPRDAVMPAEMLSAAAHIQGC